MFARYGGRTQDGDYRQEPRSTFSRCPFWRTSDCGFFAWESDCSRDDDVSRPGVLRRREEPPSSLQIDLVLQEIRGVRNKIEGFDNKMTFVLGSMWVVVLLVAISCTIR